ncbi:hypothetical protein CCR75_002704 [Bremia lactucae]|uniref:ubiquitinyl hydrolase 1 n=1 Tax=Bremia lactucae TaxID=4779 RepID=A0A976FQN6_BRELC|nr:hypothetical protein CCR75_002704 [Bremia lactucae]
MCMQRIQRNPLRSQFRKKDEMFMLGKVLHLCVPIAEAEYVSCGPFPVAEHFVKSIEERLKWLLCNDNDVSKVIPPLPLNANTVNAMGKEMLEELQLSWKTYHSYIEPKLVASPAVLHMPFTKILKEVSLCRDKMEQYLHESFLKATSNKRDQMLTLGNFLPQLTLIDLIQCAFDEEVLFCLAPKLSEMARKQFRIGVIRFMELCVLEDKVERLIWKAKRSELSSAQLVDELVNDRQWLSKEFPYWLAFEVEGRLQIRHEQFVIAQHLINQPGSVCQLNMGRGKTRVILPMLFLYFSQSQRSKVVRAHFLSPLLSEARHFMHRYLSASSFHLNIFEQPFHRKIKLNHRRLQIISDTLHELQLCGGIQLVAPEHRMSLELKRFEFADDSTEIVGALDTTLDNDKFIDILDECDALLHHRYHLVYAIGTPVPLCNGMDRWKSAEALLRVVANQSLHSRVRKVLQAPHVACVAPLYSTRYGAFDGTRLHTVVGATKALRDELKQALILDLIDHAPFEYMWLNNFGALHLRKPLLRALTDPSVSLEVALGPSIVKLASYTSQLLALRGLVAFGVLEHCLEKRYRVNFGLPLAGARDKKIAIPFSAADVPSERSEFSHPDVCIVLTVLGYYHRGLQEEEVRSTFNRLLRLDISEQQREYNHWFKSVESSVGDEVRKALNDVRHISLADIVQFDLLVNTYKFCMEAINFYLNTCVFPKDTQQYPKRLSRTAWNLAAGKRNIGFSGTNDNHRLLPLSVTQREPDEPVLLGTNGRMIDKILQVTHSYDIIYPNPKRTIIPWQSVLLFSMDKKAQALIDTGALLAGVFNHDAAKYLLEQSDFAFAGVTYFDSRIEKNCWMIAEKARRIEMPLKESSMLEKDTFVIFDEARSRGSDMKLLTDAVAVLTLGPKLTKDKMMQGAGRMRQLGCNQSLYIASFDEVAQSIFQFSGHQSSALVSPADVLNWVIDNTKAEAVRGLLEWGGNGLHFQRTQLDQDCEFVDDDWALEVLYQGQLEVNKISEVILSKAQHYFEKEDLSDEQVKQICNRGFQYGLDDEVCVTSHTDECERELQVEEEVQQQREIEMHKCTPSKEQRWVYSRILGVQSVKGLCGVVGIIEMTQFVRQSIDPEEMAILNWARAHIYGTSNFFATIQTHDSSRLNMYLRLIDVVLVFKNGDVLLVSECEADHILELLWSTKNSAACNFCFFNLAFAHEGLGRAGKLVKYKDLHLAMGSRLHAKLPLLSIIACDVFNGETMMVKGQEEIVEVACRLLIGPLTQRESVLSNFVTSRGNSHKWTRSLLHELCCRLDLEDCK